MNNWFKGMAALALTLSIVSFAETSEDQTLAAAGEVAAEVDSSSASLIGAVEIRPTVELNKDAAATENLVELGANVNDNVSVSFVGQFNTDLVNSTGGQNRSIYAHDFFIRAKIKNIWESGNLSLTYQPRLYLPSYGARRDAGMSFITRQYFSFTNKVSDAFSLSAHFIPMYHQYSQDTYNGAANPDFEGRVYLIGSMNLTESLSVVVPVLFSQTHYRGSIGEATNAGSWRGSLYVWPEVWYTVNSNLSVGAAWRSGSTLGFANIDDNIANSQFQAILRASL